jgi:DNA-binding CsgD family transcriptional regulator
MNPEQLNSLIGAIYDCAITPSLWPDVLQRICEYSDSAAGTLAVVNLQTGQEYTMVNIGIADEYNQLYKEKYHCTDLFIHPLLARDLADPAISSDLVSDEQLLGSRIYREWAQPQGFRDTLMTMFTRQPTHLSFMGLTRRLEQRRYDESDRAMVRQLAPHLQRALTISDFIKCRAVEVHRFAELLDSITTATWVIDSARRVLHANLAATGVMGRNDVLAVYTGILTITGVPLARLVDEHRKTPSLRPLPETYRIQRRDPDVSLVIVVMPLWSPGRDAGGLDDHQYAIFMQEGNQLSPLASDIWLKLFGLTGSELRVLQGLVEGRDAAEIADLYGVARSTVKTQLLSLFRKTGTSRQAELVKLALGSIPPVQQGTAPAQPAQSKAQ